MLSSFLIQFPNLNLQLLEIQAQIVQLRNNLIYSTLMDFNERSWQITKSQNSPTAKQQKAGAEWRNNPIDKFTSRRNPSDQSAEHLPE